MWPVAVRPSPKPLDRQVTRALCRVRVCGIDASSLRKSVGSDSCRRHLTPTSLSVPTLVQQRSETGRGRSAEATAAPATPPTPAVLTTDADKVRSLLLPNAQLTLHTPALFANHRIPLFPTLARTVNDELELELELKCAPTSVNDEPELELKCAPTSDTPGLGKNQNSKSIVLLHRINPTKPTPRPPVHSPPFLPLFYLPHPPSPSVLALFNLPHPPSPSRVGTGGKHGGQRHSRN